MPLIDGGYVNPYYQEVDKNVQKELNARGNIYGARVRSTRRQSETFPNDIVWAYGKVAYAQVIPEAGHPTLGMAFSKIMSDRTGALTLYNPTRNQPKFPLLQSIELSNEGTIGSLLKGKFVFTVYPDLTNRGFKIEDLEEAYFKPGREVTIQWGWSASAASGAANFGKLSGIIYNFNWQVNSDLSITAEVNVVSKATITMGISGEQTNPDSDDETKDPLNNVIPDGDIAGMITSDIAELGGEKNTSVTKGHSRYYSRSETKSGKKYPNSGLAYFVIGMPKSQRDSEETPEESKTIGAIVEPTYFIKLGDLAELVNGLIAKAEEGLPPDSGVSSLFRVACNDNVTEYLKDIVSCTPEYVFFPDAEMGKYGDFQPFKNDSILIQDKDKKPLGNNLINIGNILISTGAVIDAYRGFIKDNQTSIELKNITGFFDVIIKKINYASGETYQLSARLLEPEQLQGGAGNPRVRTAKKAILSIEDNNLSQAIIDEVTPFHFNSSIAKPILKSVSISSKPPAASAAGAYAEARAAKGTKLGPQQSDVRTAQHHEIDVSAYNAEFEDAKKALQTLRDSYPSVGPSDKFSTDLKSAYAKYKRSATGGKGSNNAHWLNRAIYPIDLTLVIDGINGFKFGDVIKTNLIPATYNTKEVDMVFVITKISHIISAGGWETTLITKARINMGNPNI